MPNVLGYKNLLNSMHQAPNLERLFCKSEYISAEQNFEVTSCGKNFVCCFSKKKTFIYIEKQELCLHCYLVRLQRRIYWPNWLFGEGKNKHL